MPKTVNVELNVAALLTVNVDLFALVTFAFHLVKIKVKVNNRGFQAPFIVSKSDFET